MEVHHAHHPAHKKKISEYFVEFFMLFFAVTLGFFAENYREHTIIDHRMQENYQAIVVDLLQDNMKIDSIFKEAENGKNLVKLSHLLYQYKKSELSESQLIDSIYKVGYIPSYTTLFVNNTSFKNMQSSGLLSYVSNKDLKGKLSYYYEVLYKKINDNNKLFDDVGINYFDKYLAFNQGNRSRKLLLKSETASFYDGYENDFKDPQLYRKFLLQLKLNRNLLTSDEFINKTNVYITRYYGYQNILTGVKENNNALIALLGSESNH
jgi:hypothetical protein